MPAPYNYMASIPRPDLARSVQAGAALGEAIGGAMQASRDREFQQELQNALRKPGFRSFNDLMSKYPDKAENIAKLNADLDAAEKESIYKTGLDVYTSLETGNIDTAKTILDEQIAAGKNAGRDMRVIEDIRKKMDQDPRAAQAGIGLWLAGSDPKRWDETTTAFEARSKKEAERRKVSAEAGEQEVKARYAEEVAKSGIAKTRAEIENNYSQISDRARRYGLDEKKAILDIAERQKALGAVPEAVRKDADAAIIAAGTAEMSANELNGLADRIDNTQFGRQGAFATAEDFFIDAFGGQSEAADIRKEFTRLRNSEIIKSLPPGPATDRDISIFAEGYTKAIADPARMSAYLRGAAKLRDIEAKVQSAKADWLSTNGSLQRARRGFQAGEYTAQPGESYAEFQRRVAQDVNARYAEQSRQRELFPVTPGAAGAPAATPAGRSIAETGILGRVQGAGRGEPMAAVPAAFGGAAAGPSAAPAAEGFKILSTRPVQR